MVATWFPKGRDLSISGTRSICGSDRECWDACEILKSFEILAEIR